LTETYFPGGRISKQAFDDARVAVSLKLRPVKAHFRNSKNVESTGTSGTIRASEAVARELGIIASNDLTPGAVDALIDRVLRFDCIADISLPGLSDRRAQVWPGGLAILVELLTALRVDRMRVSDGALREGLLYEYLGRLQHEDARDRSAIAFAKRFNVDMAQAERVARTADGLLRQSARSWGIASPLAASLLGWAAQLHEIGLDIAHQDFQKHGAYVVENADMPGFPRNEQRILSIMIRNQRGAIDLEHCAELSAGLRQAVLRLTVILRLAVLLNRSRSTQELPSLVFKAAADSLSLSFDQSWLQRNPLTVTDLHRERRYLEPAGLCLEFH
jgi:exopolyphosphatase/guanosine-5'-triphosphate,3'-diphosphate pyrophosphatase